MTPEQVEVVRLAWKRSVPLDLDVLCCVDDGIDEELSVWGRPWLGVQRADRIRGDGITDQLPYADFTPGRWALLLDDVRPLPEPVPAKGRPGVWTPDDDLTDHINKEMTP